MHHCCSSEGGNMVGQCSCGLFHSQSNSFSMLFSNPNQYMRPYDESEMYSFSTSSSSPSVDCTLSLGTPSTRLISTEDDHEKRRRSSSSVSNFCWDLLQTKRNTPSSAPQTHKSTSRGGNNGSNHNSANESLLARRCANCDTTSTPLWRNGPRGPKSLCNACGIRFKKEERRATSAASTATNNGGSSGGSMEPEHMFSHHNNSWYNAHSQTQKMPCFSPAIGNEFRFIEDNDRDSDTGIPFLSWRLNVTDRPSLVHDFTR